MEIFTKASGKMEKLMGMAHLSIRQAVCTKANGRMISSMAMAQSHGNFIK